MVCRTSKGAESGVNFITANGSGIGDARIVETLNYKQAVQRVLPIPC
jgi:hypothetical protein